MRVRHLIKEAAFEPKKHRARKLKAQAIPTRPPKTRRSPRSQPRARATRSRSGSRMLLCPANHRAYAPRTVQPTAPKRRCAIEICCPPSPLHLVCTKFVNTISMPGVSLSCVNKVSLATYEQFDERSRSRKSCPLTGIPQNPSTATTLILRGSQGNVSVVDWRENFAVVCARRCGRVVNSLSQPRRIQ
jgi:hypothetical protein